MKSKILLIITLLLTIIIIALIIYTKFFAHIPDKGGMENNNIVNENKPEIAEDITFEDSVSFCGLTVKEWKEKIARYNECDLDEIQIRCIKGNYFATVVDSKTNKLIADYTFEDETGYAYDKISGNVIDLMEGYIVEVKLVEGAKIDFTDNQVLAIGYAPDNMLEDFVYTHFYDEDEFKMLHVYDFRREDTSEEFDRFVLIPKTSEVKIDIYDCFINEQGNLELDDKLYGDAVGGIVILDDLMAETTMPQLCIKMEYKGFEATIPIVFSGMDGKLDLTGHENEIKDISVYEN